MTTEVIKKHKYYELACRAHYNTSFSPEKRAEMHCNEFDDDIAELREKGASETALIKYEKLFVEWLNAKSRCISSMITGPANFPVARAEKANNSEHNKLTALLEYKRKVLKAIEKEKHPEYRPIMSGDSDAIERLKSKLEAHKKAQETMKAVNRIVRKEPIDKIALVELLGNETRAAKILEPNYMGKVGFESYALQNNNAEIKRLAGRIRQLEMRKAQGSKEITINDIKVVQNSDAMRIQIFFNGKPAPEVIKLMKSNAFKWSPSVGAWQRQLTNNAIYAFNHYVMPELKKLA